MSDTLITLTEMSTEELYELRVKQLESHDMTTSDAQAAADYEVQSNTLLHQIKLHISKTKPVLEMNDHDISELAEEALNAACLAIQERLGITDGTLASLFFSGGEVKDTFVDYINSEIGDIRTNLE